jgi:adenosylcobinamide-phosphate synthase
MRGEKPPFRILHPYAILGTGIGVLADRLIGDPPQRFDAMGAYENVVRSTQHADSAGAKVLAGTYAGLGALGGWGVSKGLHRLAGPQAAVGLTAWSAVHGKARGARAIAVADALAAGQPDLARDRMPKMVADEAHETPDDQLASLTLSMVAEDVVDGVVGPAVWATVLGVPGALAYRGVNALDAKLGHHAALHGKAGVAGKVVDGLANLVPSYAGAALVLAARPASAGQVLQAVRNDRRRHRSSSVGVIAAAFGGALGVQVVEGGTGRPAEPADIPAAVRLSRDVSLALGAALVSVGGLAMLAGRWRARSAG